MYIDSVDAIPYAYVLVFLSCRVCARVPYACTCVCTQCHAGDSGSIVLAGANNNEPLCLISRGFVALDVEAADDTVGVDEHDLTVLPRVGAVSRYNLTGLHAVVECLALGRQLNELNSQLRASHMHAQTTTPPMPGHTTTPPIAMPAHTTTPPVAMPALPVLGLCRAPKPLQTAVSISVRAELFLTSSADGTNFVG